MSANASCDAALAFLADVLGPQGARPVVFSDTAITVSESIFAEGWWGPDSQPGDPRPVPPAELFARYQALGGVSAVAACQAVREMLTARGVAFGHKAVDRAARAGSDAHTFDATILGVTLPAVSDNGRDALLDYSWTAGPLAGRGTSIWRRRGEDGVWRDHATCMRWMS